MRSTFDPNSIIGAFDIRMLPNFWPSCDVLPNIMLVGARWFTLVRWMYAFWIAHLIRVHSVTEVPVLDYIFTYQNHLFTLLLLYK